MVGPICAALGQTGRGFESCPVRFNSGFSGSDDQPVSAVGDVLDDWATTVDPSGQVALHRGSRDCFTEQSLHSRMDLHHRELAARLSKYLNDRIGGEREATPRGRRPCHTSSRRPPTFPVLAAEAAKLIRQGLV